MAKTYSLYEAKAQLSAIIRDVRQGRTAVITLHGEPVAEIRPIAPAVDLNARLAELEQRGVLVRAKARWPRIMKPLAERPGALQRFLDERE